MQLGGYSVPSCAASAATTALGKRTASPFVRIKPSPSSENTTEAATPTPMARQRRSTVPKRRNGVSTYL
jgi:hypothetical protein